MIDGDCMLLDITSSEELLREAAKARIARMVKSKRRRKDLQVPAFVQEQWEKGAESKTDMADLLIKFNGNKDPMANT